MHLHWLLLNGGNLNYTFEKNTANTRKNKRFPYLNNQLRLKNCLDMRYYSTTLLKDNS